MTTNELLKYAKMAAVVLSLTLGATYAQASFVGPPGAAPFCPDGQPGCDAPITVASTTQTKAGSIWSNTNVASYGGGIFGTRVKIGGLTAANPKAALEIANTDAGILPPRLADPNTITNGLSGAEKLALKGLVVYNTTSNQLERYDGAAWGPAVSIAAATGQDGPAFHVHKNGTNQVIDSDGDPGSGSAEQLTFSTEEFDTHGYFTNNAFTPQIPGKYMLSATAYFNNLGANQYAGVGIYKNGQQYKWTWARDIQSGTGVTDTSLTNTAVVDANGTDTFTVWIYYAGSSKTVSGNSNNTFFVGSRLGGPVTVVSGPVGPQGPQGAPGMNYRGLFNTATTYAPNDVVTDGVSSFITLATTTNNVPASWQVVALQGATGAQGPAGTSESPQFMVAFFNIANGAGNNCPTGWSEFTQIEGRYPVGLKQGFTLRGGAGSSFTVDQEDRASGAHTHTMAHTHSMAHGHDISHTHSTPAHYHRVPMWFGNNASVAGQYIGGFAAGNGGTASSYLWYTGGCTGGGQCGADGGGTTSGPSSSSSGGSSNGSTGGSSAASTGNPNAGNGAISGTNAPYTQLLACVKD